MRYFISAVIGIFFSFSVFGLYEVITRGDDTIIKQDNKIIKEVKNNFNNNQEYISKIIEITQDIKNAKKHAKLIAGIYHQLGTQEKADKIMAELVEKIRQFELAISGTINKLE